MEEGPHESFSARRKFGLGTHLLLSVLAAMALAAMINYLGQRHTVRLHASKDFAQKLSPLTAQVLSGLTNRVRVIVFFNRREALFSSVSALIKEYQERSPMLEVEFVDSRMPGRAEAIRNQYKLAAAGESSRVIFDANGQVRTVLASELSEYGVNPDKEIQRTGFRGEQLFTAALLNVTQFKPVTAYFLQGHGEHDPSSTDDQRGYSRFARLLENNNITVKTLPPLAAGGIPEDCGLLIIAGPEQALGEQELGRIEKYLAQGGRLFALFTAGAMTVQTGLEKLLAAWDIEVGFNWVQDTEQAQAGESGVLVTTTFGPHAVMRPLGRSSLSLVVPRSIRHRQGAQSAANAPKVVELAFTSESGRSLVPRGQGNTWTQEQTGSIPLMVAAERGGIQGVAAEKGTARIIAAGDSLFISNLAYGHMANSDFANLAVNWLCNRDQMLNEIGASPVAEYQVLITEKQMSQLKWLFLATLPGTVFAAGLLVWAKRRT